MRIRPRLSYANVMSTIAVFAVLGGGAYAAHRNSVGPEQIKRNAVKKRHVARNAIATKQLGPRSVRSPTVAPDAIRSRHLLDGAVTAEKLAEGVGVPGLLDIENVTARSTVRDADNDDRVNVSAECPDDYTVVGGGAGLAFSSGNSEWAMRNSDPFEAGFGGFSNDGWRAIFATVDGADFDGSFTFQAEAICALTSDAVG